MVFCFFYDVQVFLNFSWSYILPTFCLNLWSFSQLNCYMLKHWIDIVGCNWKLLCCKELFVRERKWQWTYFTEKENVWFHYFLNDIWLRNEQINGTKFGSEDLEFLLTQLVTVDMRHNAIALCNFARKSYAVMPIS